MRTYNHVGALYRSGMTCCGCPRRRMTKPLRYSLKAARGQRRGSLPCPPTRPGTGIKSRRPAYRAQQAAFAPAPATQHVSFRELDDARVRAAPSAKLRNFSLTYLRPL